MRLDRRRRERVRSGNGAGARGGAEETSLLSELLRACLRRGDFQVGVIAAPRRRAFRRHTCNNPWKDVKRKL